MLFDRNLTRKEVVYMGPKWDDTAAKEQGNDGEDSADSSSNSDGSDG